ncbi:alkyl sulfatase dimerization domain-containing protein [Neobacillus sp. FSL H8-0543]|uniref:alkyl sulfatase dimerization domain-containing protein n=1 Tax=Neobacillus sp. FSL H8-0543 TaxID=2954672 RepID=UPI003158797F
MSIKPNETKQNPSENVATAINPNLYMGGSVEKVTMSNGAIVNKVLAKHYTDLPGPSITKLTDKITVLENYSLENTIIIEGKEGIIVWDTGSNLGIGKKKYKALRSVTDKPIMAIIYSHNHYTKGAKAFLSEEAEDGSIQIIGHPDIHKNTINSTAELGKAISKSTAQHFGLYLPNQGPDAPPISYDGGSDADKSSGYVKPNYGVRDGEELMVDGVRIQFFYTPADTFDSITAWLPDHDTVITNSIWHVLPNMYTLRGQPYRDPDYWIKGIDQIRSIRPQYLITSHGNPMKTREASYELATSYRDAMSFIYCQTIRLINKGLKPDEIAEEITLPAHLSQHPRLIEVYGEFKHQVKGVYSGLIGWFSLDAADINPVPISFRSLKIIEGYGGIPKVLKACRESIENHEYAWAAELVTHVLNIQPDLKEAREMKAEALREMGQLTSALSSRGFYLSQALELEGKVDLSNIPNSFSKNYDKAAAQKYPIETSIKLLEYKIIPGKCEHLNRILSIEFTDLNQTFGLHVRNGVAEFIDSPPKQPNISIALPSTVWLDIILGKYTIDEALNHDSVQISGEGSAISELMQSFDL